MQFLAFALLLLSQAFATGASAVIRNEPYNGLAELEKRVTTIPNLVPTTTVQLKTDSTYSTQTVSPNRDGETSSAQTGSAQVVSTGQAASTSNAFAQMGHHRATVTSSMVTGTASYTPHAAQTTATSSSSKGGASGSNGVPMAGMFLLGLLAL